MFARLLLFVSAILVTVFVLQVQAADAPVPSLQIGQERVQPANEGFSLTRHDFFPF
jgi:hypothetical protein